MRALIKIDLGAKALKLLRALQATKHIRAFVYATCLTIACATVGHAQFLGSMPDGRVRIKLLDAEVALPLDVIEHTNIGSNVILEGCKNPNLLYYVTNLKILYHDQILANCVFSQVNAYNQHTTELGLVLYIPFTPPGFDFAQFHLDADPGLFLNPPPPVLKASPLMPGHQISWGIDVYRQIPSEPTRIPRISLNDVDGEQDRFGFTLKSAPEARLTPQSPPEPIVGGNYYLPPALRQRPSSSPLRIHCFAGSQCQLEAWLPDGSLRSVFWWKIDFLPEASWTFVDKLHQALIDYVFIKRPPGNLL